MFLPIEKKNTAEPANRARRLMNEHDYYINVLESIERAGSKYNYARQKITEALQEVNEIMEIKQILPETEILTQLAEECAELSQAALKLRRVLDKTNPTPVTEQEAREQLIEEISDVACCLRELDITEDEDIIAFKYARWLSRLKQEAIG